MVLVNTFMDLDPCLSIPSPHEKAVSHIAQQAGLGPRKSRFVTEAVAKLAAEQNEEPDDSDPCPSDAAARLAAVLQGRIPNKFGETVFCHSRPVFDFW